MLDFLIVGAGLYGATCARLLTDAGKSVRVIERRDEVGGNCHDKVIDGVRVSSYGGHIFHTNSERIWEFVGRFADWLPYIHRVKANHAGRLYSFPPNRETFKQLGIAHDAPEAEGVIRKAFFEGYTAKQWGKPIEDVPAEVLARIPIRNNADDRYFTDTYQGLPADGYTAMIARMLDGVEVQTGVDYLEDEEYWNAQAREVIYTGALDQYYGYDAGRLEYRSLTFDTMRVDARQFQGAATVNYCDLDVPYTRIMDWGYFWPREVAHTVITAEYPAAKGEPYYPVNDAANNALHAAYQARANKAGWLHIGGRLGAYRYWNMDQTVAAAMAKVERLLEREVMA
jgi:UDP-galactopyranose mutase